MGLLESGKSIRQKLKIRLHPRDLGEGSSVGPWEPTTTWILYLLVEEGLGGVLLVPSQAVPQGLPVRGIRAKCMSDGGGKCLLLCVTK